MTGGDEAPGGGWSIRGEPALLVEAAARLRGSPAGRRDAAPLPGEFVMFGVARLLDTLAVAMEGERDLPHDVVSAAEELAHHVLTYIVPRQTGKT
jgi:hypothetical protein